MWYNILDFSMKQNEKSNTTSVSYFFLKKRTYMK